MGLKLFVSPLWRLLQCLRISGLGKRYHWVAFYFTLLFPRRLSYALLICATNCREGSNPSFQLVRGFLQHGQALSLLHAARGRLAMHCWVPVREAPPYLTWQFSPPVETRSRLHDAIHDLDFPPLPGC